MLAHIIWHYYNFILLKSKTNKVVLKTVFLLVLRRHQELYVPKRPKDGFFILVSQCFKRGTTSLTLISPASFFPVRPGPREVVLCVCCSGSTRRLNRDVAFCCCFWRSPGSNLRPLVYKVRELTTAPRRRPFDGTKANNI